ncbi:MAG: hypothetical protein COY81_02455 [Candidatus Pacebacteria bacterium CG_4_10_14_0_8_um_filter_43_12]|nr:MAG: hypothetical protein COY81_02455 [Candidatus Pacebacteria bacterium CG_4_10_14_0_8_um_filter_43_12]
MKEHPIPQDITSYRFHIVGSMTLKQFGEVLVGVLISLAIYQTNLVFIIKWPLIVFFAGGGLLAAFVPIEERPISHWLATFFGIIYKPTQFFWKRAQNIPEPFLYKGDKDNLIQVKEVDLTPQRRQRIKEFLNSTKSITPNPEDLTVYEEQQLSVVMNLFETSPQAVASNNPTNIQKPTLTIRVRPLLRLEQTPENIPVGAVFSPQLEAAQTMPNVILPDPVAATTSEYSDKKDVFLKTEQVAQNIEIPEEEAISIKPTTKAKSEELEKYKHDVSDLGPQVFFEQRPNTKQNTLQSATQATFNAALPFPDRPTEPNRVVGMVLTKDNQILANAIVEISTEKGSVVRAVKTNPLGQFSITTPLRPGQYLVEVQKDGFVFEPIQITLKDSIVDPLEIRSK